MSDFAQQWKEALADEAEVQIPLEVVVTCAYHQRVLVPGAASDAILTNDPQLPVWGCPDPTCPVKTHITIQPPAQQEEAQ